MHRYTKEELKAIFLNTHLANELIPLIKNNKITFYPPITTIQHINNDIYYIDIQDSIKEDKVNVVSNKDGIHLSQIGNNYYFGKIDKVLSYKF